MRKFSNLMVFTLFALFLTVGCKSTKNTIGDAAKYKPLENALLWKIEGKDIQDPSYLYGTIHIIDAEEFYMPEGTLAAIDAAKRMVFEINMEDMNDMGKMMGIMGQAFMKDGKTLSDLLSKEDYQLVSDHFDDMGMPLMMLERIKPMFLSVFASADMDPNSLKTGAMKSYEMEFMEIAESKSLPMGGLETIEFQMGLFDSIPYEDQAVMLVESIQMADTDSDQFDKMIQMYKDQNIQSMITMLSEDDENLAEHEDVLVGGRNRNWIPIMSEMMGKEPVFFAVGAGHLAGPSGVIHLLRKEGYKLTPISQKK